MSKRHILWLVFFAFSSRPMCSQSYLPGGGFCIHGSGSGIKLPLERFLLIRKGDQLGALRLIKITPDVTTHPRAGEWLGDVSYESYYVSGTQPALNGPLATRHVATLHFGRMKGFGFHYSWQSGNLAAAVGPWKFSFFSPNGMFMTAVNFWNGINNDSGLEFAPTSETNIAKLDARDPRLRWFHSDKNADMPCPISVPPQEGRDDKQ
jgi:hypothetical protein